MKYNQNPLSQAISKTLCAAAATSMALTSGVVFAQDQDDEEGVQLDRVQVTGSRIKRVDIEGAQPVTVIDREEIDLTGFTSVADLLRSTPFNSFGSFVEQSGFGNAADSTATVSLRGLGSQRTLVLLNGRRFSREPGGGAEAANLNTIPLDIVERVEILRDGASAIYGSDAIAGVINIITRSDLDGAALSYQYSDSTHPGGETNYFSVSGGMSGESGNVTFAIEHSQRSEIFDADIPNFGNAVAPGIDNISSFGFPGSAALVSGAQSGLNFPDPRCPSNVGESSEFPNSYRWNFSNAGGDTPFVAGSTQQFNTRCGYNFAADTIAIPSFDRTSIFVNGSFDVTNNTQFVTMALVTQNEGTSQFAGAPVTEPVPFYSADNPNNPINLFIGNTYTDPGLNGGDPYTFTEADRGGVNVFLRTVANGPRTSYTTNDQATLYAGFQGTNDWFGGSDWNLGYEYQRARSQSLGYNLANKVEIQNAIDNGTLDLFNVQGLPFDEWDRNTVDTLQLFNHTGIFQADTTTGTFDGSFSFDMFQMNAGPVPLVVGFEYWDLEFNQQNDPEANRLIIAGTSGGDNISGVGRDVLSFYAETVIPLLSTVELGLALRYDDYSDFGDTVNPQVGLTWRPTDSLLIRGTFGTGFRAPNMQELYGNISESFPPAIDRVGCANGVSSCNAAQYRAFFGGNPELQPEESDSYTAGVVWNATDDLSFELTYYSTEFSNQIAPIGLQSMFNLEADGFSNTVVRNPDGTVDFVSLQIQNLSGVETSGIDFGIRYTLATDSIGMFSFRGDYTYILDYDQENIPGDGFVDQLDQFGVPDSRATAQVSWTMGDWFAAWNLEWIGENGAADQFCTVDGLSASSCDDPGASLLTNGATFYNGLQAGWNTPWDGQITIGCNNCFDEDGPQNGIVYGWQPIDRSLYNTSVLGRVAYARYRQNF